MSVRVMSQVFRHSRAEMGSRLVALVLADSSHDDGITWISQGEIAEKTRLSERQVRRCLLSLEELGEVEVLKVQRGRKRSNLYFLKYPDVLDPLLDRLPSEIREAISRPDDMSGGPEPTTGHLEQRRPDIHASRVEDKAFLNRKENRNLDGANAPSATTLAKRPRNIVYDALAEACEIREQLLDSTSPIYDRDLAREVGAAQGAIRSKAKGLPDEALAEEVALRARAYRERWPEIDLTPSALAKHWNRVVIPTARSQREEEIRRWAAGE